MSFFDSLNISATGLTAERTQMDVTAENLANAQSTNNGNPYKPQAVELQAINSGSSFQAELSSALGGGAATPAASRSRGSSPRTCPTSSSTTPETRRRTRQGYVKEPNIQPVTEMTNLISESNAYQADVTAMDTSKQMYSETLQILK